MDKIVEVLKENGWPPATLLVVVFLAVGIYFLYMDNRDIQKKWEAIAQQNLEANVRAIEQRRVAKKSLDANTRAQEIHAKILEKMEAERLKQRELDRRTTIMAVQVLKQVSQKLDVHVPITETEEFLEQRK